MCQTVCGIIHDTESSLSDKASCILPYGHEGPHEFKDQYQRSWLWETDWECTCEHCMRCEGDYCTIYWEKNPTE